jgi:hypothetical protein
MATNRAVSKRSSTVQKKMASLLFKIRKKAEIRENFIPATIATLHWLID